MHSTGPFPRPRDNLPADTSYCTQHFASTYLLSSVSQTPKPLIISVIVCTDLGAPMHPGSHSPSDPRSDPRGDSPGDPLSDLPDNPAGEPAADSAIEFGIELPGQPWGNLPVDPQGHVRIQPVGELASE